LIVLFVTLDYLINFKLRFVNFYVEEPEYQESNFKKHVF